MRRNKNVHRSIRSAAFYFRDLTGGCSVTVVVTRHLPFVAQPMTQYEFLPDPKRPGRNRYLGSWTEPAADLISLPYTSTSLRTLLKIGQSPEQAKYTHQQIARWCDLFVFHFFDDPADRDRTIELEVAQDVSAQWDLTIANTFTLEERRNLNYSEFQLPCAWFTDWLEQLETRRTKDIG